MKPCTLEHSLSVLADCITLLSVYDMLYTFISYQYLVMTAFGYLPSHDIIILFDCMFLKFYKTTPSLLKRTLITDISNRRHTLNYQLVEYFLKIQRVFYRFIYSVCKCCNKPKYHSVDYVHNYKVHE